MATSFRSPIARVRGLGSAKEGVEHWKLQRLTAISNLLLVLWFMVQAISMTGADYPAWQLWFASPIHATLMALFVISIFLHAKLGLQVVIEDYVHGQIAKIASIAALNLVAFGLAAACIVSIIKISVQG